MAISCAWIIWEAIRRIRHNTFELRYSVWPVLVLLTSIAVDFWRSTGIAPRSRRTGSPALATDAFHFASDIWASLAVLLGLLATWVGVAFHIDWLRYADPVAAIFVLFMIIRITAQLTREAVGVLMDQIPVETRMRVIREAEQVPAYWLSNRLDSSLWTKLLSDLTLRCLAATL